VQVAFRSHLSGETALRCDGLPAYETEGHWFESSRAHCAARVLWARIGLWDLGMDWRLPILAKGQTSVDVGKGQKRLFRDRLGPSRSLQPGIPRCLAPDVPPSK
jgi:hypothetical protein